ncbi:zinc ribbon domain-containing protein [Haloarcula litorea]|uniref:zinc ribbon domain-containing protein n=1 Tax=Haloarcula litorea TaxID=3032579 RepID=UPI0023E7A12C|nr:zinc ribbon domain-containing protein [Halomicroarcula sp. GDY20]
MVEDPRCPHCTEKVSATATWCMHCGRDFDAPIDAESGRTVGRDRDDAALERAIERGDVDGVLGILDARADGPRLAGVGLALLALVTVPLVAPTGPGIALSLLFFGGVAAVGLYAADQPTVGEAIRDGATALAVLPFLLAVAGGLFFGAVSLLALVEPAIYAGVVVVVGRRLAARVA